MRKLLSILMVLALSAPVFGAAAKKKDVESKSEKKERLQDKWPSKREIDKAQDRVKYDPSDGLRWEFRGKRQQFIPADLSHYGDGEKAAGVIAGKLILNTESKNGLRPGTYVVYVHKDSGRWEAYFCQQGEPVAKSKDVSIASDNAKDPIARKAGAAIQYWYWEIEL